MSAKDRIQEYIDSKGITVYRLESEAGLSKGYWSKTKNISSDILSKISRVYSDIDMNWVINGHVEMFKDTEPISAEMKLPEVPKVESGDSSAINSLLEIIKNQSNALKEIALNEDKKRFKEQEEIKREISILHKILDDQDKMLQGAYEKLERLESDNKVYKQKNVG